MRGGIMQRLCPKCHGFFAGQLLCPKCGVQLTAYEDADSDVSTLASKIRDHVPPLQAPFFRRLLIGLVIAQGLFLGLRELTTAAVHVFDSTGVWWETPRGLALGSLLQLGSLFFAALVGGAGHSWAVLLGLILGIANAGAILGAAFYVGLQPERLWLYGQPPLHILVGILGGLAGRLIWKPVQGLPLWQQTSSTPAPAPPPIVARDRGPISWGRILVGTALAFSGTIWAQPIRGHFAGGVGSGSFQGQFITWQVSILAVLLGSGFAGANTRSGFRHGLIVGFLSAGALLVAQLHLAVPFFPAHEFWINQLGIGLGGPPLAILAVAGGSTFVLATIGGWLGSQLFPPTVKMRYRSRDD